ncbi:MAG: hypothetical protein KatS3mg010_0776 [Acidimicrobiia bacterium]|nr:MAG: hypothetical protein KatS3mg010_0776 [Acidimicrobiia bacterium]
MAVVVVGPEVGGRAEGAREAVAVVAVVVLGAAAGAPPGDRSRSAT